MKATTRKKLEAAGRRVRTVREFLGLTDAEAALVLPMSPVAQNSNHTWDTAQRPRVGQ